MPRIIIEGTPGEVWQNDTSKVMYQFRAVLSNTCGVCLQYHLKVGSWWPIPIHFGCRCTQTAIRPGDRAPHPFVDFRKLLDAMPHDQQVAAVGASAYKLIKSGVVPWDEVVTPGRIRTLREVVSRRQLSVEDLVKAGVRPAIAEQAHAAVGTPEHVLAEAQKREAIDRLKKAGVPQQALADALAARLAGRVSVGRIGEDFGATGVPTGFAPLPGGAGGAILAAELAKHLTAWKPAKKAAAAEAAAAGLQAERAAREKARAEAEAKAKAAAARAEARARAKAEAEARAAQWRPSPASDFRAIAPSELRAWGDREYERWADDLTPRETIAFKYYTGSGYKDLNAWLRGRGPAPRWLPPGFTPDQVVAELDRALAKGATREGLVLHRGINLAPLGVDPARLKPGDYLPRDPAYTSTSPVADAAWEGAKLEIRVPRGTPGAYVEHVTENRGEREFLLGRSADTFRVVEVRPDGRVVVEVVPSAP